MKKYGYKVTYYPEERVKIVTDNNGIPFKTEADARYAMWIAANKKEMRYTGSSHLDYDELKSEYEQEKLTVCHDINRGQSKYEIIAVYEYWSE